MNTKALISCAVTAQLTCAFDFTLAKIWFSHDAAHTSMGCQKEGPLFDNLKSLVKHTDYLICCVMYLSRKERKDSISSADKSVHSLITLSRTVVAAWNKT